MSFNHFPFLRLLLLLCLTSGLIACDDRQPVTSEAEAAAFAERLQNLVYQGNSTEFYQYFDYPGMVALTLGNSKDDPDFDVPLNRKVIIEELTSSLQLVRNGVQEGAYWQCKPLYRPHDGSYHLLISYVDAVGGMLLLDCPLVYVYDDVLIRDMYLIHEGYSVSAYLQEQVLSQQPEDTAYHTARSTLYDVRSLLREGNWQKALQVFETIPAVYRDTYPEFVKQDMALVQAGGAKALRQLLPEREQNSDDVVLTSLYYRLLMAGLETEATHTTRPLLMKLREMVPDTAFTDQLEAYTSLIDGRYDQVAALSGKWKEPGPVQLNLQVVKVFALAISGADIEAQELLEQLKPRLSQLQYAQIEQGMALL